MARKTDNSPARGFGAQRSAAPSSAKNGFCTQRGATLPRASFMQRPAEFLARKAPARSVLEHNAFRGETAFTQQKATRAGLRGATQGPPRFLTCNVRHMAVQRGRTHQDSIKNSVLRATQRPRGFDAQRSAAPSSAKNDVLRGRRGNAPAGFFHATPRGAFWSARHPRGSIARRALRGPVRAFPTL